MLRHASPSPRSAAVMAFEGTTQSRGPRRGGCKNRAKHFSASVGPQRARNPTCLCARGRCGIRRILPNRDHLAGNNALFVSFCYCFEHASRAYRRAASLTLAPSLWALRRCPCESRLQGPWPEAPPELIRPNRWLRRPSGRSSALNFNPDSGRDNPEFLSEERFASTNVWRNSHSSRKRLIFSSGSTRGVLGSRNREGRTS